MKKKKKKKKTFKKKKKRCIHLDANPHSQDWEAIVGTTTPRTPIQIPNKIFTYITSRE